MLIESTNFFVSARIDLISDLMGIIITPRRISLSEGDIWLWPTWNWSPIFIRASE